MRFFNQLSLWHFLKLLAIVKFYTCIALQVKEETKHSKKFLHMDVTAHIPNCFGTKTSGNLLCSIIFDGAKRVKFYHLVSLILAS